MRINTANALEGHFDLRVLGRTVGHAYYYSYPCGQITVNRSDVKFQEFV